MAKAIVAEALENTDADGGCGFTGTPLAQYQAKS